jgi:hypothetical protein
VNRNKRVFSRLLFGAFASLADVAKGGDGAKSALREIFYWRSPAKNQHSITEMESLTQENKDRGEDRNRSWPNCQPKKGLPTVNGLY